ncbi:MAG: hydrogenase maturation protease [Nitrospirae bacterium]|nr:hydrogenase maturation protease [Nitrospirota bacterium]
MSYLHKAERNNDNHEAKKKILILCAHYPYSTDTSFGYHVFKELEKLELPDYVELLDVGEFASLVPHIIEGKDKMIVIDVYRTNDEPGTIVRLKPEKIPIHWDDPTDVAKYHLLETIQDFTLEGICPETILIGVVPKDIKTTGTEPTPEIKSKIKEVIDLVIKEIKT